MAAKPKKTSKREALPKHKTKAAKGTPPGAWFERIAYGLLGCLAFYFLLPIMAFKADLPKNLIYVLTLTSGALAVFGTTGFFKRNVDKIALWTIPLIIVHMMVNVLLTYAWVGSEGVWLFIANTCSIPLAITWYFILKYKSVPTETEDQAGTFAVSKVYAGTGVKVAGLIILLVCGFLVFYRLGYFDIWEDENLVINAAKGFYEKGFVYFKDGYERAWLHTILCAGSFHIFGISEFSGRVPSAVFGVLFVLICFYVFARWYGLAWLALFIPLICLMNDRFLILFRYMRMYALLIPLFVLGVYTLYKAITLLQQQNTEQQKISNNRKWGIVLVAILFFPLLAHIHKLSMVLLPVLGLFVLYLVWLRRTKTQLRLLWISLGAGALMLILTFVVRLEALKMFSQVATRIFSVHQPMPAYFEYMFANGLPLNSTLMLLMAGLGLLGSRIPGSIKSILVLNYLLIVVSLVSMVYLIGNEGRDYRYIAHIVPFVICTLLLVIYYCSKTVWKGSYPWAILFVFMISTLQLVYDYDRVYVRHPWAPSYSIVYATLRDRYKPGDALFAQNIKTYYLDPVALAGTHYHKLSKKSDYSMEQFLADIKEEGHGWVIWELHKSHHWSPEIIEYIYENFKAIHNSNKDDLGVELFYFDETMIAPD